MRLIWGRAGCPAHGAYRGLRLPVRRLNPARRLGSLLYTQQLPGGRRSSAAGAIRTNGAVSTPRRHAGEQRCAARWPAASYAGPHRENCPEVGVPWRPVPSARMAVSPPRGVMRGSSDAPLAGLRPTVPTGGRRSLAAGAICTKGGVFALRRHAGEQRCAARWPAASYADRRSAFPGGWGHPHEWRCLHPAAPCGGAAMRRPLACGQLCRPEVGVPWRPVPSARMAVSLPCGAMRGSSNAPPAGLRPAVPTGGRRSLAAGAICANGGVSTPRRHAGEQR